MLLILMSLLGRGFPAHTVLSSAMPLASRARDRFPLLGPHHSKTLVQSETRGGGILRDEEAVLLSRRDLLDLLRPKDDLWLQDSVRRRVCHACVAGGKREKEVCQSTSSQQACTSSQQACMPAARSSALSLQSPLTLLVQKKSTHRNLPYPAYCAQETARYGVASETGDLRWLVLLCKECVSGPRPLAPHLIPLFR